MGHGCSRCLRVCVWDGVQEFRVICVSVIGSSAIQLAQNSLVSGVGSALGVEIVLEGDGSSGVSL